MQGSKLILDVRKTLEKNAQMQNFPHLQMASAFGKGNLMRENESDKIYILSFKTMISKKIKLMPGSGGALL